MWILFKVTLNQVNEMRNIIYYLEKAAFQKNFFSNSNKKYFHLLFLFLNLIIIIIIIITFLS